jgi:hypothetical protein
MKNASTRDRAIAVATASIGFIMVLFAKPLGWITAICAILFALGTYPTVANALALARGDRPSLQILKGEGGTNALGPIGSVVSPATFVAFVLLIWFAS